MFNQNIIVVDAAHDLISDKFINVAMVVADNDGKVIEELFCGVSPEEIKLMQNRWMLGDMQSVASNYKVCRSEREMLQYVWRFWLKYRNNSFILADNAFPVEHELFTRCVEANYRREDYYAPSIILDVSSILFGLGIDPYISRYELLGMKRGTDFLNSLEQARFTLKVYQKLAAIIELRTKK